MFNYILLSPFYYITLVIIKAFLNTALPRSVLYVHTVTVITFPQSVRMYVHTHTYVIVKSVFSMLISRIALTYD